MCAWSASNTFSPRRRRRKTTNVVSKIGTASTSSGKNSATVAAVFKSPCTATVASTNPSSSAPESPMKIRAG